LNFFSQFACNHCNPLWIRLFWLPFAQLPFSPSSQKDSYHMFKGPLLVGNPLNSYMRSVFYRGYTLLPLYLLFPSQLPTRSTFT
jgi:hypothetical protein